MAKGTLFLIPVPLAEGVGNASFTALHETVINSIDEYIVENEKTARRFLKEAGLRIPQQELIIHDYGKHKREEVDYEKIFSTLLSGRDMGLMSEAGCPGVADPGAELVDQAHRRGIKVVPLVGPSSILLALMASGFNGQSFSFQGYLPIDKSGRAKTIKDLEQRSAREGSTQIFIETPFRNNQLITDLLKNCRGTTKLCIASNLTAADESILSKKISEWKTSLPDIHKKPAIFLLFAG
ncbi:MAG: SAM-dependent methyltransferase [Sphingobacterium sp.]